MANFFRIVLFILPAFFHSPVFADTVPAQDFYDMGGYGSSTTKEGACSKLAQYGYSVSADGNSCSTADGRNYYWVHSYTCSVGTLSGSSCINVPPPLPKCTSDFTSPTVRSYTLDAAVNTKALQPSDIPAQSCIDGCTWQTQGDYTTFSLADGSKHIEIGTRPTGVACTIADTQPAQVSTLSDTKKDCLAKGNSFGQINGIDICVKSGTPSSATVGTKSDVQTKSTENGLTTASVSSSASTVNGDGSVTTNTTNNINNADGSTSKKQDSKTEDKQTFCQENPTSKICLDDKKSSFNGACPQSTCDGDAIQCAIAKRQQQDACDALTSKDTITSKPTYNTGEKLVNGQFDTDVQGFLDGTGDNKRTVNLPSSLSESGDASYVGVGFTDLSVSVLGRNITLPISRVNEFFGYFGFLLLGLAYISSYKIVSGAI